MRPLRLPVPDIMRDNIYQLTPPLFLKRGVRLLLLDVDNTIAPYTVQKAPPRLRAWADMMRTAGLSLYILSNSRGARPERFAAALDIPYRKRAWKPFLRCAREVLAQTGRAPAEAALIGDQIYTDVLCARNLGALAVLVKPIQFTNPLLFLRYCAEAPFRLAGKHGD